MFHYCHGYFYYKGFREIFDPFYDTFLSFMDFPLFLLFLIKFKILFLFRPLDRDWSGIPKRVEKSKLTKRKERKSRRNEPPKITVVVNRLPWAPHFLRRVNYYQRRFMESTSNFLQMIGTHFFVKKGVFKIWTWERLLYLYFWKINLRRKGHKSSSFSV